MAASDHELKKVPHTTTSTGKNPENSQELNLLETFAQSSTMHGLHCISSSKSRSVKMIWFLLLSMCFYYMVQSNIMSIKRYYQYPFTTEVTEEFAGRKGLKFPAITVCPMNLFVKKKIEYQDANPLFNKHGLNLEICEETRKYREKFNLTCGKFLMCTLNMLTMGNIDCGTENKIILNSYLKRNPNPAATVFEEQFREKYGPKLSDSLVLCRSGSSICNAKDFTTMVSRFGKCHQWNGNPNNASWAHTTGHMLIILDAKVHDSTPSPFFTEGFRIHIQEQGSFTSPDTGFIVSPGYKTSVQVRQKRRTYLKDPYKSNCTDKSLMVFPTYTMLGCALECLENLRIAKCRCRSCGYRSNQADHIRVCGSKDSLCEYRLEQFVFNPKMCNCPPPCSEITYDYKLSYSVFPDTSNAELFEKELNISVEYQRKNLLAVDILYDATSYSTQSEKETYTWESLLGEFGGNLGLMVGCSVLTAAEFGQLFILLIYGGFQKLFQKLRCTKTVDREE